VSQFTSIEVDRFTFHSIEIIGSTVFSEAHAAMLAKILIGTGQSPKPVRKATSTKRVHARSPATGQKLTGISPIKLRQALGSHPPEGPKPAARAESVPSRREI
jgi:hypothetical protein